MTPTFWKTFGGAGLALAGCLAATAALGAPSAQYQITKVVPLGAPDRWDYLTVDEVSHRVFISHGDRVSVVDGRSGAVVGAVEGMPGGTHGIAIVTADGKGYTDDGRAGVAVAFDLKTLKVLKQIPADMDADGAVFDWASGHVFIIDGDSGHVTVIDPKTDTAIATVDGGGGLEFGVSGDNGKLYINGVAKQEVVRIDTSRNVADAHWPMPGCTRPHGLTMDRTSQRLFASCANNVLTVLDSRNGAVIATLPIGRGSDAAVFDPKRKLVFSSQFDGTISVIWEKDANTFVPLPPIKTAVSGRTMGIDRKTGRLFVVAADLDPAGPTTGRPKMLPGTVKLLMLDPTP